MRQKKTGRKNEIVWPQCPIMASERSRHTERQPQAGSVCMFVYNLVYIVVLWISQHLGCYQARVSSSWAHVLMAEVVCWSSCHVELVKDNAWPCRHDTDTSPLQKQREIRFKVCLFNPVNPNLSRATGFFKVLKTQLQTNFFPPTVALVLLTEYLRA